MTQYARPDADTDIGDWLNSDETDEDLFDMVNESSTDDSDYISVGGGGSTIVFALSDVDEPDSGTRTVVVRAYEDSGFNSVALTVTLKEGSTSKGSQSFSSGFSSAANLSFNITSSISDYSDLNLTISATDMSGMATTTVYQAYFSVPDAASAEADTSEAFLLFVD